MTYEKFVKTYYRMAMAELNQYCHYCGIHCDVNYIFEPDPKYIKEASNNSDILPWYEFTDEAPTEMIEQFFDFYGNLYPENKLFMTPVSLKGLYDHIVEFSKEEDKQIDYLKLMIDLFMTDMVERGVLV